MDADMHANKTTRELVRRALSRLMKVSNVLWPARGDRQLAEGNLSLHVAHELLRCAHAVVAEWPFELNQHIDLIAYSPKSSTLVLLEAKRVWQRSLELGWLCKDADRLTRAAKGLGASSFGETHGWDTLKPKTVIGVLLASSTDVSSLDPTVPRRGQVNETIQELIRRVGAFDHVAHKDTSDPYVAHYATWIITPSRSGRATNRA